MSCYLFSVFILWTQYLKKGVKREIIKTAMKWFVEKIDQKLKMFKTKFDSNRTHGESNIGIGDPVHDYSIDGGPVRLGCKTKRWPDSMVCKDRNRRDRSTPSLIGGRRWTIVDWRDRFSGHRSWTAVTLDEVVRQGWPGVKITHRGNPSERRRIEWELFGGTTRRGGGGWSRKKRDGKGRIV